MQQGNKVMKNKHNKKRNTAFLYEVILREITNSLLEKNEQNKKFLVNVCRSFFSKNLTLKKESDQAIKVAIAADKEAGNLEEKEGPQEDQLFATNKPHKLIPPDTSKLEIRIR